jgi:hypothetical protein
MNISAKNLAVWCMHKFPPSSVEVQKVLENRNLSETQQHELITSIIRNYWTAAKK